MDPNALPLGLVGLVGIFICGLIGAAITILWPSKPEK